MLEYGCRMTAVCVPEAQIGEGDIALFNDQCRGIRKVGDQAGLIQDHCHVMGVTQGMVNTLHHRGQHIETQSQVIGVGKHHDEGARADAEPGVAARQEKCQDCHDHDDHRGSDSSGKKRPPHAAGVVDIDFLIDLSEQISLVLLPAGSLDRENVGNAVGELTGQAVLGTGCLRVELLQLPEQVIDHQTVDDQKQSHNQHIQRDQGQQDHDDEYNGRGRGDDGVCQRLHQLIVGTGEFAGLTDQRAAVAVVMEGHGLVGQHVKAHGGQVVIDQDLQFPKAVILEFAADLSQNVAHDQGSDGRSENRKDLVGRHM